MSNYIVPIRRDSVSSDLSHAGIKGMRWGIRRYQNEDGSLTDLGKQRYSGAKKKEMDKARETAYNAAVKRHLLSKPGDVAGAKAAGRQASKDATATTKVDQDKLIKEMVKKDLDATNTVLKEGGNASRALSNNVKQMRVNVKRMDLSGMSDQEMRTRIAREQLESQYDSMFNRRRHRVENGKQAVAGILEGIGTATTVTASALAIALAIKDLRGG